MEGPALIVVYPSALLGWEVVVHGRDEPFEFEQRADAIEQARVMAETMRPCKIQIEDWYGHIECEWMFALDSSDAPAPAGV